jgi:hypothetical protein
VEPQTKKIVKDRSLPFSLVMDIERHCACGSLDTCHHHKGFIEY